MLDPEKDWVKNKNTRRAIGRRTVLRITIIKVVFKTYSRAEPHLSKILDIVKLREGTSPSSSPEELSIILNCFSFFEKEEKTMNGLKPHFLLDS